MNIYKVTSYLFHPVLFSSITAVLFFILQPKYIPKKLEYSILAVVFLSTYVIPVLFLFILKKKNTIENYHLETINERKFPVLFFIILNSLLGLRLLEFKITSVNILAISYIAISVSLIILFILFYKKLKISLHTLAIGNLTGFLIYISYHYRIRLLTLIASAFILFGIIAISRLKLKAHTQKEVFLGFFIGLLTQLLLYLTFYKI